MSFKRYVYSATILSLGFITLSPGAQSDNLYNPQDPSVLVGDIKASRVGDVLSVVIVQAAEARNSAQNSTHRRTGIEGAITGSGISEFGEISLGSGYRGVGEIRRSESFVTQMSAEIVEVFSNGDYLISGRQIMAINGENTEILVRGRVRAVDIGPDNTVLSNRIANAEINYQGEGFVTKGTRPGLLTRIFNFLGLG